MWHIRYLLTRLKLFYTMFSLDELVYLIMFCTSNRMATITYYCSTRIVKKCILKFYLQGFRSSPGYVLSVVHKRVTFLCLGIERYWTSLTRGVFYSYSRMSVFIRLSNALRLSSSSWCNGKTHASKRLWSARPATTTIPSDILTGPAQGKRGTLVSPNMFARVCACIIILRDIACRLPCVSSPVCFHCERQ